MCFLKKTGVVRFSALFPYQHLYFLNPTKYEYLLKTEIDKNHASLDLDFLKR